MKALNLLNSLIVLTGLLLGHNASAETKSPKDLSVQFVSIYDSIINHGREETGEATTASRLAAKVFTYSFLQELDHLNTKLRENRGSSISIDVFGRNNATIAVLRDHHIWMAYPHGRLVEHLALNQKNWISRVGFGVIRFSKSSAYFAINLGAISPMSLDGSSFNNTETALAFKALGSSIKHLFLSYGVSLENPTFAPETVATPGAQHTYRLVWNETVSNRRDAAFGNLFDTESEEEVAHLLEGVIARTSKRALDHITKLGERKVIDASTTEESSTITSTTMRESMLRTLKQGS